MNDKYPAFKLSNLRRRDILKFGSASMAALVMPNILGTSAAFASELKSGGVLNVGLATTGAVGTWDPDTGSVMIADSARYQCLYSKLVERDNDAALVNHLVEELSVNETDHSWTLRVLKDVEFHNGKTVDADDLIFSLQRHAAPKSIHSSQLASIIPSEITKLDDRTIRIPMKAPFALLPVALSRYAGLILPVDFDPSKPVGTGPFKLVAHSSGRSSNFVRFENYAFDKALVDELNFIEFADSAAMFNALAAGQVDAIHDVAPSQLMAVKQMPHLAALIADSPSYMPICMNLSVAPFTDQRVTEAFRLIADRQQMVDVALGGNGTVGNDVFGRFDSAYIGDKIPQRSQDIEKAKALLAEAGVEDLTVDLYTTEVAAGIVEASTLFAQHAELAGVTVNVIKVPPSDYFGTNWLSYQMAVDIWKTPDYFYPATVTLAPNAPYNETHFSDKEWNDYYAQALAEYDDDKRNALFAKCQEIDHLRGGNIVWGFTKFVDAASAKVKGWPEGRFSNSLSNWAFDKVSVL